MKDVVILGGGPAGYTAALYCARAGLESVVVERMASGGQAALADWIENYPGFDEGIDGIALGERMRRGAERFGAQTLIAEARSVDLKNKEIETSAGSLAARALILATGASPRMLNLPGEEALRGRGVSYCAACDGPLYRGRSVVVVGGGNSAASDALILSKLCTQVTIVHRRDQMRADRVSQDALLNAKNVSLIWNSAVEGLLGQERLTGVRIGNVKSDEEQVLPCEGLFISIGRIPETGLFQGQLPLDESGAILSDDTRTPISGVYAAGDVRSGTLHQIVCAAADGALAAMAAEKDLR